MANLEFSGLCGKAAEDKKASKASAMASTPVPIPQPNVLLVTADTLSQGAAVRLKTQMLTSMPCVEDPFRGQVHLVASGPEEII